MRIIILLVFAFIYIVLPVWAQQVTGTPDDPGATIIVLPSQSWTDWLLFYGMGLMALFYRIGRGVSKSGGLTIDALKVFVRANNLSVLLSGIAYTLVILVWCYTDMLQPIIGWYQGVLTGGTILVGLSAEQFLGNLSADQMRNMRGRLRARGTEPVDEI